MIALQSLSAQRTLLLNQLALSPLFSPGFLKTLNALHSQKIYAEIAVNISQSLEIRIIKKKLRKIKF